MWATPTHNLLKIVIKWQFYKEFFIFTAFCSPTEIPTQNFAKVEKWIFDVWFSGNRCQFGII